MEEDGMRGPSLAHCPALSVHLGSALADLLHCVQVGAKDFFTKTERSYQKQEELQKSSWRWAAAVCWVPCKPPIQPA